MITIHSPHTDPGVLAVEGFLTEEEESKILDSLADGADLEDEPETAASDSAYSVLRSLQAALSPKSHALAAMAGIDGTKITVIQ